MAILIPGETIEREREAVAQPSSHETARQFVTDNLLIHNHLGIEISFRIEIVGGVAHLFLMPAEKPAEPFTRTNPSKPDPRPDCKPNIG